MQIYLDQDGVSGIEAETAMQRAQKSTHGHQGRTNQQCAEGDLHDKQYIPCGRAL